MEEQKKEESAQPVAPVAGKKADKADVEKHKTMAILAYFIFFLPLITDAKDSPFAKFHANQSLVLLLASIVGNIVLAMIPFVGWFLMATLFPLAIFAFFIIGILNASKGEMKELPVIGGFKIIK